MADAAMLNFKPTAGGYVFRAPSPWIFGPSAHFLVSEQQRTLLETTMKVHRPGLAAFFLATVVVLDAVAAFEIVGGFPSHNGTTLVGFAVMTVLILALLYVELFAYVRLRMRRLQSILPTLTPTDLRITNRELREMIANRSSPRTLLYVASLQFFVVACNLLSYAISRPGSPQAIRLVSTCVFGVLAISTFVHWLQRTRTR